MRLFLSIALLASVSTTTLAHHPDKENQPVHPRIDVIPPLGTSLKMSYRRRYNRPPNWAGKIAYYIAPSSQEAMAWHNATHRGYYENDSPRIVTHYFYPKPWEAMRIGPRPRQDDATEVETVDSAYAEGTSGEPIELTPGVEALPAPTEAAAPAPIEAEVPAPIEGEAPAPIEAEAPAPIEEAAGAVEVELPSPRADVEPESASDQVPELPELTKPKID